MLGAFWTSLVLAATVTVLSIVIAVPAAWTMARLKFLGRDLLFNLFTAPLLLPTIVLGLAMVCLGPWMLGTLVNFTANLFRSLPTMIH